MWDLATGELRRTLQGYTDAVNAVAFTPDGRYAVSGGRDRSFRLWQIDAGEVVTRVTEHNAQNISTPTDPSVGHAKMEKWAISSRNSKTRSAYGGSVQGLWNVRRKLKQYCRKSLVLQTQPTSAVRQTLTSPEGIS